MLQLPSVIATHCSSEARPGHTYTSALLCTEDEVATKEVRLEETQAQLAQAKDKAEDVKRQALRLQGMMAEAQAKVAAKQESMAVLEVHQ